MLLLASALSVSLAAAAPGPATPEVRSRVVALLGAIERPVSADAFRGLGAEGEAALAEVAASADLPVYRARALEALAALGAARAEELHRTLASDRRAPAGVRRAAVRGLGTLVAPARATEELRPFLADDPDASVRAAAAGALTRAAPADGCAAVRLQAAREPPATRAAFRRALRACERTR